MDSAPMALTIRDRAGNVKAVALVDPDVHEWASRHRWALIGYAGVVGRRCARRKTTLYLHRLILGLSPGDGRQGDHINRDRLDNRRVNLRVVTGAQNTQNTPARKGSSSVYRGVSWQKRPGKWRAQCRIAGKDYFLGEYRDEIRAARVADEFRLEHMPFAHSEL